MHTLLFFCTLTLALGVTVLAAPAAAQDTGGADARRTVSVSGEGIVTVAPDQATVRFGIVTEADEAEAARQQNAEAASQAMSAVRALGIPEEKIRLETLRLQPRYEYTERRGRQQDGYEAMRQVVVELDSLDLLPTLVARVVQEGANQLGGVQYGLQDRDAVRNEALREAVRHARAKAELLTDALDVGLGRVVQISEQSFSFPQPRMAMDALMVRAESAQAAPEPEAYAAGEIEVSATVQVVFALQ